MNLYRVVLVAIVLVGGVCGIVAFLGQPTPTPNGAITTGPEYKVESSAPSEVASKPALIGTLRSSHHVIHLYAGKFSVEDANGKLLANLVTKDEFAKLMPELFGEFQQMYAEGQLIADNRTGGKLPTGWSYSARPVRVKVISDP